MKKLMIMLVVTLVLALNVHGLTDYEPVNVKHLINGMPDTTKDNGFNEIIDITTNLTDNIFTTKHETRNVGGAPTRKAFAVTFNFTYNESQNYFIRFYTPDSGQENVTVRAYIDNDNISTVINTYPHMGIGWFMVPANDVFAWIDANATGDVQKIRFYSRNNHEYSEIELRQEFTDTTPPTIENCTITEKSLLFGDNTTISCDVADENGVENVTGTLDGQPVLFMSNDSTFVYSWSCNESFFGFYLMSHVNAFDVFGNYESLETNLAWTCGSINYTAGFKQCDVADAPVIGINRDLPFTCVLADTTQRSCVAFISHNNTILSTAPRTFTVEDIGLINAFETQNGLLHGYYNQYMMKPNTVFELQIQCGTEHFNKTIAPIQKGLTAVAPTLIWSQQNVLRLFVFILVLALFLSMIIWFLKFARVIK